MELNDAGQIASTEWEKLANRFCNMDLGEFVVMPNHIHGIIVVADQIVGQALCLPIWGAHKGVPLRWVEIVGAYKSITTDIYIDMVKNNQMPAFDKRIWQRNYMNTSFVMKTNMNGLKNIS